MKILGLAFDNRSSVYNILSTLSGLSLYGNNIDLTDQYNSHTDADNPFSHISDDENLIISKRDDTMSVLFHRVVNLDFLILTLIVLGLYLLLNLKVLRPNTSNYRHCNTR